MNKAWITPLIADIFNAGKYSYGKDTEWLQVIVDFLCESKGPIDLDNYRPMTLLSAINAIMERIFGNRLKPPTNQLAAEDQNSRIRRNLPQTNDIRKFGENITLK